MKSQSLRRRFVLAGCLLVAATVASGAWSVWTFARLSAVAGDALRNSQEAIDLSATLAGALEREDDALLLALAGDRDNARRQLGEQRRRFDEAYARLPAVLTGAEGREAVDDLRRQADAYRRAGDALLGQAGRPGARAAYHEHVNPALRRAVADCARVRELGFRSMRQAGVRARDEAGRATGIVAGIAIAALAASTLVAVRLARAVLGPVRELTRGVAAVRADDLGYRVRVGSEDELGRLAEGFNRMAETLADYRNSSLGELLLAKSTLESTLAALPDAVIVIDPDGRIASTNPLAQEVLAATGAAGARRARDLPLPPAVLRAVEDALRNERPREARADLSQALAITLNGRPLKMVATVAPIPAFLPRRNGAAVVLADVTDFARLDELRSELVAVASHELKTPLTSLQMNLLLLEERAEDLTPRQREMLAAALLGGQELAATIEELLDLTRIEAGQLRLLQERVDLAAVVEQVVRNLRPRFEDAEVLLRVVNEAPGAAVRGDPARLRVVLANLLTNALKYTPRGGEVTVRLSSRQIAAAGGGPLLQLAVTDTGPGIPREFRERVFEKFFRVEHHRPGGSEGVRGTGIGLYLCREIIEAHGGTIRCEPGDGGRGTRVAIHLEGEGADGE